MSVRSAWLSLTGQNRADTRLALSSGMAPSGTMTARSGVVPDGGLVLQSVSAMQCQITAGRAYVQGVLAQGAYPIAVDAPVSLTVPDGDPQYARVDLVVLQVQDDQFDGSGLTQAAVVLIPGTPAASPVPPPVPAASLALWKIAVPSKASAGTGGITWGTAVTDLRVYTSALGGIVPAGTTTWTPPAAGQYSDLNGLLQRYTGSTWSPVYDPTTLGNAFVCTSTTRPTGVPAGKQVYETDTGRVSLWTGSAWVSEWDPTAYTSTTRPGNNWPGRVIYETDTTRFSAWNGSAWVTVYDPNFGYGAWTNVTLSAGWSAWNTPQYRTAPGNRIELRGIITATTNQNSGNAVWSNGPSTSVNRPVPLLIMAGSQTAYLYVTPNAYFYSSASIASGTNVSLEGLSVSV